MYKLFSIIKNELSRYFHSPLAYVYLISFLCLNASFTLYLGDFLDRSEASLNLMFAYLPWIYLIFISGIAMRLWADEFKNNTVVQIFSLPISPSYLIWGKFIAAWLFCAFGLALTFPFVVTVNVLGSPDNCLIVSGYLACLLLSAAMLAVAQTVSALTRNQVIALILSVILNLLFFLSGIEYVLGFFRTFLPSQVVDGLSGLSFLSNFYDISSGLIGLKNILFFVSVVIAFNYLTVIILQFKTYGVVSFIHTGTKYVFVILLLLAWLGFVGFNLVAQRVLDVYALDVTKNKTYTISNAAKNILTTIQEPVTIKIYYSPILSERNPVYRDAVNHLRMLLKNYKRYAQDNLHFKFYYPQFLNDAEDMALHDKMISIPLPDINQNAFFGLTIIDEAGRSKSIPLISLINLDKIEQDILQNIYELSYKKPTVGILTSLPIFGIASENNNEISASWQIIEEISKLYKIVQIKNPNDITNIDVLLLIHPQKLSNDLTDTIKKYVLKGGKSVVLADIAHEAERLYSPTNTRLSASNFNMLNRLWGFDFNPSVVVADLDNSITANVGSQKQVAYAQDVIQFNLFGDNINKTLDETSHLSQLLFSSATTISHIKNHNSSFFPLVTTSENSALFSSSVIYENVNPLTLLSQFEKDGSKKTIAAKIISNDKVHPFEVIVIGDSDFAYDDFWGKHHIIDDYKYLVMINDNLNFLLNALDSMANKKQLFELRRNRIFVPKFDAWENLRKHNSLDVAKKERKIFNEINVVKEKLNNLWQQKDFEERQFFSDDELTIIADFRNTLQKLKRDLSELKLNQDKNLHQKKSIVVFWNLYAIPMVILLGLFLTIWISKKKPKHALHMQFKLSTRTVVALCSCVLLFLGGLKIIYSSSDDSNTYENTLVFPNWEENLNKISEITLQKGDDNITFYKVDGFWHIKDFENYPLYQRRIVNLLASLANARYLEKKSARAEYLANFGLDSKNATNITLKDADNKVVLDFQIGNFEEEISRGRRGAFLKFNNRFQVWLIDADFISLSTNWRDWTLNTILNIRFGRIKSSDLTSDQDTLIVLMKELLNTPLTEIESSHSELSQIQKIKLYLENDDEISIYVGKNKSNKNVIYYQFGKTDNAYLRLFAAYVKDKFYEIPNNNMENIEDVFSALGQTNI